MWSPDSWRGFPASQQPVYSDFTGVESVVSDLRGCLGVVDPVEIDSLVEQLGRVILEGGFLLHAGDCAETFVSCTRERVLQDCAFLEEVSSIVDANFVLGRICGQFGKPRSNPFEGVLPVFRGDIINGLNDRSPDPNRMLTALNCSRQMYQHVPRGSLYTSHECLLLPYESALVRCHNAFYNTSAHFLWIGDRTRELDGAHVEFCRGIANPVGIKVGPSANWVEILEIVDRLNPKNIPGKITIITRFGAACAEKLPQLIETMRGRHIVWQCDPMHGNTVQIGMVKTRYLHAIMDEIEATLIAHQACDSRLHGIHLETTGTSGVTECVGGNVGKDDLHKMYLSACDPRLNPDQTRQVLHFLAAMRLKRQLSSPSTEEPNSSRSLTGSSFSDADV